MSLSLASLLGRADNLKNLVDENELLVESHTHEKDQLNEEHTHEIDQLNEEHTREKDQLNEEHLHEIDQLNKEHLHKIDQLNKEHRVNIKQRDASHIEKTRNNSICLKNAKGEITQLKKKLDRAEKENKSLKTDNDNLGWELYHASDAKKDFELEKAAGTLTGLVGGKRRGI